MRLFLCIAVVLLIDQGFACLSSAPRQYAAPAPGQYYYGYGQQGQAPQVAVPAVARAAAAGAVNHGPASPINSGPVSESLFGRSVLLSEYNNNGYNSEGGGPVNYGSQLQCNLDKPCCWVNVPSPEDQIDWQVASGVPESQAFQGVNIQGNYLVAYAAGAAPSDEAQFASCSIACASSPIRVRARHWQSRDVLLQVCQRESFPNTVNINPLLNCQEFPAVQGLGYTEVVLPKASLVDIVFVASNFIDESGSIAVLDDISIDYESNPNECASVSPNRPAASGPSSPSSSASSSSSSSGSSSSSLGSNTDGNEIIEGGETQVATGSSGIGSVNSNGFGTNGNANGAGAGTEGFRGNGFANSGNQGSIATAKGARTHGASTATKTSESSNSASSSSRTSSSSSSSSSTRINVHKTAGSKTSIEVTPEMQACNFTKCNFEEGTACQYSDAYQTQSVRGLTTRFQVVKGQFMNRVTGVHQGTEGNYYAATYLYPREVAGLQAEIGFLPEDRRLRFQYYEGTHGVQLKGCCDTSDNCPFHSDKFVTVSDRMWKYGSFTCPKGTERFIFLCENTNTNQGACGLDDIQVVENRENIKADDQPIC